VGESYNELSHDWQPKKSSTYYIIHAAVLSEIFNMFRFMLMLKEVRVVQSNKQNVFIVTRKSH